MMKNRLLPFSLITLLALPLLNVTAEARAGYGNSMGSRGSRTWSTPPRTSLTPGWSRPMERSITPPPSSRFDNRPSTASGSSGMLSSGAGSIVGAAGGAAFMNRRPAFTGPMGNSMSASAARPSFAARHPFLTGFAGGMLGAGMFGILSGHGLLAGIHGFFSFIGFLIQIALFFIIVRFFINWWKKHSSSQKSNNNTTYTAHQPLTLTPDDYRSFQELLVNIQAAWSAQNTQALQRLTTPEMAGYFNEQLSELASRGARNIVSNVQFLRGDLSEVWREKNLSYATVAMCFSMIDVTTDSFGNVIDGSKTEPQTVTELWTFLRADGRGNWVLSAIQQAS